MFVTLLAVALFAVLMLGVENPVPNPVGPTAINARNAKGGPVPPTTNRDRVLITIYFAIAIAAVFVGLYYMK